MASTLNNATFTSAGSDNTGYFLIAGTYQITALSATETNQVNEGGVIHTHLTTTNVSENTHVDFTVSGITTGPAGSGADFGDISAWEDYASVSSNSTFNPTTGVGYFNVNASGEAEIRFTINEDLTTEGSETFKITLHETAQFATCSIIDTSITPPTYAIAPNVSTISEGGTVTWTVTTTGVADGTTLSWHLAVDSIASDSDFSSPAASYGDVTINSNTATFNTVILEDELTEGSEILKMVLWDASSDIVATAIDVTISDTSITLVPATINWTLTEVDEASYFIDGNIGLTWKDITNSSQTQTVYSTGTGTFEARGGTTVTINGYNLQAGNSWGYYSYATITTTADGTVVSNDVNTGTGTIESIVNFTPTAGETYNVSVVVTAISTYAIAPNVSTITEGDTVTWTVTTTGVADGTTLYWTNSGTSTTGDFDNGWNVGSVTISSNTATFSKTILDDDVVDPSETIIMNLRTVSYSGTIVATSSTVTIDEAAAALSITSTSSTNVSCYGGDDGTISYTITGGAPAYTTSWSPSTPDIESVSAGTYTLTVTDSESTEVSYVFTITQPATALSATSTVTSNSSTVTAAGGTSPYTILWSNGQTSFTATGLTASTNYTYTVTDANVCTFNGSTTTAAPALTNSFSSAVGSGGLILFGSGTGIGSNDWRNGSATLTITSAGGGNAIYEFRLGTTGTWTSPSYTVEAGESVPGSLQVRCKNVTSTNLQAGIKFTLTGGAVGKTLRVTLPTGGGENMYIQGSDSTKYYHNVCYDQDTTEVETAVDTTIGAGNCAGLVTGERTGILVGGYAIQVGTGA